MSVPPDLRDSPAERRRAIRHDVDLEAKAVFDGGAPMKARVTNISQLGLFLSVESPPPVGASARIEISHPKGDGLGLLVGRVVRRVVAPAGAPMPTGVGVELSPIERDWITRLARGE
jgi:hypothetical protein